MASFTGPATDGREYEVVYPDDAFLAGSRIHHVRELDGSRSLCGHACDWMSGWSVRVDWHPEDVDADERCLPCYGVLDLRKRQARGETKVRRGRPRKASRVVVRKVTGPADIARMVKRRDHDLENRNREIADAVRVARDDGSPMHALAAAMGMTRQGLYLFLDRVN